MMKTYIVIAISILFCDATLAQTATPPQGLTSCYLDVKNIGSSSELRKIWEADWGSYDRDRLDRVILAARAGTVGRRGGPVRVDFFFIGRQLSNMARVVYGRTEKSLDVRPGYFAECYAASPRTKSHVLHLEAISEHYVSGAIHDGWVVSVVDLTTHREIAMKASSDELARLFNDTAQFQRMLDAGKHLDRTIRTR